MFQEETILWKEIHGVLILAHSVHVTMHECCVRQKSAHLFFVETLLVPRIHAVHSAQMDLFSLPHQAIRVYPVTVKMMKVIFS